MAGCEGDAAFVLAAHQVQIDSRNVSDGLARPERWVLAKLVHADLAGMDVKQGEKRQVWV